MPDDISLDLITRAQNGEPAVIGEIFERYHISIFRYLYYRLGDRQQAEDLTSEVFLRMMKSISNYRPRNVTFQAWLFQIARNLAIDQYRKAHSRVDVGLEEEMMGKAESVEPSVDRTLTGQSLYRALEKLTGDQRDVIVLRFIANMPIAQVAQTLHKSEFAVKSLQRRALSTLREILTEWEVSYA
jgi:RNA polymerase sigma-70 factor, ECF subfamily